MFPDDISLWTYETVAQVVEQYEFEPGEFDYKSVLSGPPGKPEPVRSLLRTACSLANSLGGWILFGVQDRRVVVRRPTDRIVGIPMTADMRKEFGDKMQGIVPDISFEAVPRPIPLPNSQGKGIFVVRIPLSQRRPHQVRDTGAFYKRGAGGAAQLMDVFEVRDQMIGTDERWRKYKLLRLELAMLREAAKSIAESRTPHWTLIRLDTTTFKALLADVLMLLPSDDEFIRKLLIVPQTASTLNQILDEARDLEVRGALHRASTSGTTYAEALAANVRGFEKLCRAAEAALDGRTRVF